ncbi:hypothetical protein ACJMK2_018600 [Sinanodonta woodiana]|uniref:Uncharacterized protein n=1 Tax=Sinanodonta woodiana TaxID=1069815 RepID=A0ABD3UGP0_SINWO
MWSKDKQGTHMLFDKGKYQAHSVSVDNVEDLFPKLRRKIKVMLNGLKSGQFSGAEIIATLLPRAVRESIETIEIHVRNKALENEGKRMSEEAKNFALKDAAKDEINKLVAEALCCSSSRRKRSACALRQTYVELVEDSVEITDAGIKFKVYEMNNHRHIHEITDDISLSTKALSKRQNILLSKIHLGLGVHSAFANFFGALHYFQTGDNARGGFFLLQSLHSVGQLTGLNEKIAYKLSESTSGRIVNKYLQQSAKKIASTLFKGDTMVEKAASKIDLLIRSVPIVGIAFDIYFIEEDIVNLVENQDRDLVQLYAIDISLDSVISLLSFDPLLEPVVLALSMIRMVFEVKLISSIKVKVVDSTDPLKTCFSIVDVNTFSNQPSVSIITIDNIIFEIKYSEDSGIVEKVPLILDFSKSQENVSKNLLTPEYGNIQMSRRDKGNVITIMDSTHSDHIIVNNKDNFLSCSGGDPDYLEGRGGQDLYVIKKTCSKAHISNYDPFEKLDKILVKSDYNSLRVEMDSKDSVVIRSKESAMMIVLLNWFVNSTYQHLVVETEDGVTCTVPTSKDEVMKTMNLLPVEMRFTEQSCKNEFHTTLNLNDILFKNVQKVVVRPKSCIVSVIGNALGNHIDLGPISVA